MDPIIAVLMGTSDCLILFILSYIISTMGDKGIIWDGNPFLAVTRFLVQVERGCMEKAVAPPGCDSPIASTASMAIHGMQGLDS